MNNKVSIIMPIYNRENKISQAIDSVLNQNYKNIELILINDGSTDNTEEICLKYKKKDKRIIYLKVENSGPGGARNKGIDISTGKYIMFIDSDDYYDVNMVKTMVSCINKNNIQQECVICNRIIKKKNKNVKIELLEKEMKKGEKSDFIEFLQKNNLFNSPCNKIYLKSIIEINNIRFDERFMSGEDYKFNLDYFNNISTARTINKFLYNYVMNDDSIIHNIKYNDFFLQVKLVDYNKKIYLENSYDVSNIYYKYIKVAIGGISYKIESQKKYKLVKEYIGRVINYPSIQEILKKKFKKNMEQKIFYFLLKNKMKRSIYIYIYCRMIMKKIIYTIRDN